VRRKQVQIRKLNRMVDLSQNAKEASKDECSLIFSGETMQACINGF